MLHGVIGTNIEVLTFDPYQVMMAGVEHVEDAASTL